MLVFVKELTGGTTSLEVAAAASVADLKAAVAERAGAPVEEQRLLFGGKVLDAGSLAEAGIASEATVHLIRQKRARAAVAHNAVVAPLGVAVSESDVYGFMKEIVPANSAVPLTFTSGLTTCRDNQTKMRFQIFEGSAKMVKDNKLLGSFMLTGIAAAPNGGPSIKVTMSVDKQGVLSASARDTRGGAGSSVEISMLCGEAPPTSKGRKRLR
jgi:molecular chaperone DnaK